jgi:hypothetical protein
VVVDEDSDLGAEPVDDPDDLAEDLLHDPDDLGAELLDDAGRWAGRAAPRNAMFGPSSGT